MKIVRWFVIVSIVPVTLLGCFGDVFEDKAEQFSGTYDNRYNRDLLVFASKMVEIQSDNQWMKVPFSIEDHNLIIEVKNSSKEKRPDIVMRIHGNGEVLTCSACAMYDLSNIWTKVDAQPISQP